MPLPLSLFTAQFQQLSGVGRVKEELRSAKSLLSCTALT
jgi:hypothetical protein